MLFLLTLLSPAFAGGLNVNVSTDGVAVSNQFGECDCKPNNEIRDCEAGETTASGETCPNSKGVMVLGVQPENPGPIWQPGEELNLLVQVGAAGQVQVMVVDDSPKLRRGTYTVMQPLPEDEAQVYLDHTMVLDATTGRLMLDTGISAATDGFEGRIIGDTRKTLMLAPSEGRLLEVSPELLKAAGNIMVTPDAAETVEEAAGAAEATTPVVQP